MNLVTGGAFSMSSCQEREKVESTVMGAIEYSNQGAFSLSVIGGGKAFLFPPLAPEACIRDSKVRPLMFGNTVMMFILTGVDFAKISQNAC